jgi:hypothetical protein
MRRVVLSFWISLDGYSCDEGSPLASRTFPKGMLELVYSPS